MPATPITIPTAHPAPLPYAGPLARHRISVTRTPCSLILRFHRAEFVEAKTPSMIAAASFSLAFLCMMMPVLGFKPQSPPVAIAWMASLFATSVAGIIFVIRASSKFGHPTRISVTPRGLSILQLHRGKDERAVLFDSTRRLRKLGPFGTVDRSHWPLSNIGRIRGDLFRMGLTIQITGKDLCELLHHLPRSVRLELASLLQEAAEDIRSTTSG